ncbi:MAG: hypothetical protein HY537_13960 [Deltaproteobacteria bacterium]|nr:hypothetical protein [Deltaproteobacteria bacterium]
MKRRTFPFRLVIVVFIVMVALGVEVFFLLHQMRLIHLKLPWSEQQDTKVSQIVGFVLQKTNILKHRSPDSLSWYPMGENEDVRLNDSLMTGANATARIRLQGGSEVELQPETLISFSMKNNGSKLSGVFELEIDQGIITTKSTTRPIKIRTSRHEVEVQPQSEVIVSSPTSLSAVPSLMVKKGSLAMVDTEQPARTLSLKEGETQGTLPRIIELKTPEASSAAVSPTAVELVCEPLFPGEGSKLAISPNESITIRWLGDQATEIEIDRKSDFSSLAKYPADRSRSVTVVLDTGHYFWRLRSKTQVSAHRSFTVAAYRLSAVTKDSESGGKMIKWDEMSSVERYQFQLSKNIGFSDLVLERTIRGNRIEIGHYPIGTYYARIKALSSDAIDYPFSNHLIVQIKKRPSSVTELPKRSQVPVAQKLPTPKITSDIVKKEPAVVVNSPEHTPTQVTVPQASVLPSAVPVPTPLTVPTPSIELTKKESEKPRVPETSPVATTPSPEAKRSIASTPVPESEVADSLVARTISHHVDRNGQTVLVHFEWSPVKRAVSYQFQLSEIPDFSLIRTNTVIAEHYYRLTLELPADFFWRVRAKLANGSFGNWSEHKTLSVGQLPE